jgi:hypothetical protein
MLLRRVGAGISVLVWCVVLSACRNPLAPEYEYEEQLYLQVDGEASVVVNASVDALVALRGAALDPAAGTIDRDAVQRMFTADGCTVERVSRGWRRSGRLFVQIRVHADDVRTLDRCALLSWSRYALEPAGQDRLRFRQVLEPPGGREPDVRRWSGDERVAFRVHAPSRVFFHNVKRPDGTNGTIARGNILTWEQRLSERLAGTPVHLEIEMGDSSILNTAILLFAGAFAAAVLVLAGVVWLIVRRGRRR